MERKIEDEICFAFELVDSFAAVEEASFFGGDEADNSLPVGHGSTEAGDGGDRVDAELGESFGFSFKFASPLATFMIEFSALAS